MAPDLTGFLRSCQGFLAVALATSFPVKIFVDHAFRNAKWLYDEYIPYVVSLRSRKVLTGFSLAVSIPVVPSAVVFVI